MRRAPDGTVNGGRFEDLYGRAAVRQAVAEAGRAERVITAALILGGAWLVARSPGIRRVLWTAGREAVTTWLPFYFANELREAWRASARPQPQAAPR